VLSIAFVASAIPPLKEAAPTKVACCSLVASTDLEKALDKANEETRGANAPLATMGGRPANIDGRSAMGFDRPAPVKVGRPSPSCQGSQCARGHGTRPTRALSPCSMIGKEHRSITPMRPTMGALTPRKVIVWLALVINSSSDDDLPLVKHDTRVDLNPSGAWIRYTQEPALAESPPCSPLPYTVSGWWTGVGYGKVLIPNPDYKGKGHIESNSSNPRPRMEQRWGIWSSVMTTLRRRRKRALMNL
jgi:hypothetical protein